MNALGARASSTGARKPFPMYSRVRSFHRFRCCMKYLYQLIKSFIYSSSVVCSAQTRKFYTLNVMAVRLSSLISFFFLDYISECFCVFGTMTVYFFLLTPSSMILVRLTV